MAIFEQLKAGVERDVSIREEIRNADQDDSKSFLFQINLVTFRVLVVVGQAPKVIASVRFALGDRAIEVSRDEERLFLGQPTLSDDGRCRLRVDNEELDLWQFRKRALEDLFFGDLRRGDQV